MISVFIQIVEKHSSEQVAALIHDNDIQAYSCVYRPVSSEQLWLFLTYGQTNLVRNNVCFSSGCQQKENWHCIGPMSLSPADILVLFVVPAVDHLDTQ